MNLPSIIVLACLRKTIFIFILPKNLTTNKKKWFLRRGNTNPQLSLQQNWISKPMIGETRPPKLPKSIFFAKFKIKFSKLPNQINIAKIQTQTSKIIFFNLLMKILFAVFKVEVIFVSRISQKRMMRAASCKWKS